MGNQDNGNIAQFLHTSYGFQHFHLLFLAQRRGWLVQNKHLRPEIDSTRNRQSLSLAARHGTNSLLRVSNIDAYLGHFFGRNLVHFIHFQKPKRRFERG